MVVTRWKGNSTFTIPINKYRIKWDKAPSKGQQVVQDYLHDYWEYDIVLAEMRIPGCKKRFDIVNCSKRIIIEYSPVSHHGKFNKFFHKTEAGFRKAIKSDMEKIAWAERNNFHLVEIVEADLDNLSREWFLTVGIKL